MSEAEVGSDPNGKIRRVMIVGVSGYLGCALAMGLRDDFEVIGTYHAHPVRIDNVTAIAMNCVDGGEVLDLLRKFKPDAVIYCAGISDGPICEEHPNLAESLHFKSPTVFFKILPLVLRFAYVSCDTAIGTLPPANAPFDESTTGKPESTLAKTRHQGETMTVHHKRYTSVFRLAETFGEPLGWNAIGTKRRSSLDAPPHWLDVLQASLQKGQKVALSDDHIRSYLYVGDFVRAMRHYLGAPPLTSVLYNVAASDSVSQFAFGKMLAEKLGYDPDLIQSKSSGPFNLALSPAKFTKEYKFQFQSVAEGLDEFAERLRTGHTKSWS